MEKSMTGIIGVGSIRKSFALMLCFVLFMSGCAAPGQDAGNKETQGSAEAGNGENKSRTESEEERVQMPDFEMTLLDGETVSFEDYRGKKVLMNFWATWCGPCVGEMPALQRLAEEYPDELAVLAVNCGETQDTVEKFNESNEYTFPIILDTDGAIQAMFGGLTSIPVTVIIDEEGYIVTGSTGASDADTMYEVYKEALGL